jgi:phospholipase D1/2
MGLAQQRGMLPGVSDSDAELDDTQTRLRAQSSALLEPGETCWRIETADRAAVLIDAEDYFQALRHAFAAARERVFIIGWDVDSRTRLSPDKRPADGLPATLLPFLKAVLRRRPQLQIYIVAWDFSLIYALEREFLPSITFAHAHPRLHFLLDGSHAIGASHHQKFVVVDDRLAFVGGIDLTIRRWDRAAHGWHDPQRVDPDGQPYAPMHDLQLCFDGTAAGALADLARERLARALEGQSSRTLKLPPSAPTAARTAHDLWPPLAHVDFAATTLGIARTWIAASDPQTGVREIEALTRRVLANAEHYIYIENQYLTSAAAADALAASLQRRVGPEIVVVLPKYECGWLERSSMGVLRHRVLQRLRSADPHGRLHLFHPKLPDEVGESMNVHAKLMIVDGRLLKIGSANLSNRSLGLDTECDIAFEARPGDPASLETRRGIQAVLHRLLAEHLALTPEQCAEQLERSGSLYELIASRAGQPRCLEALPETREVAPPVDLGALGDWAVDPERPMAAETFVQGLLPADLRHPGLRSIGASIAMLTPLLVFAWLCHGQGSGAAWVLRLVDFLQHSARAPLYVWLAFALGCIGFVPVSLLLAACVVVFDPLHGFLYALSGALIAALLCHRIGRTWREATLRQLRGRHGRQLQRGLRVQAFRATLLARLLPAGNFTAGNLLAGALNFDFWRFFLGNLVGLACGIAGLVVFAQLLASAFAQPDAWSVSLACACGVTLIGVSYGLARSFVTPARSRRAGSGHNAALHS